MDKKGFLKKVSFLDNNVVSSIYDKIILAQKINKVICTGEFYTPQVWKTIESLSEDIGINVYSYGVFEDAERRIIAFSNDNVLYYPVNLIKVKGKSKFNNLKHKDYLGAIMALGIKREKFGDLILSNDECYAAVHEEIVQYIKMNLTSIGKSKCTVDVLNICDCRIPKYDFQESVVNVSSLRIDCVVSTLCNIARGKAEELIRQGKVLVDYSDDFRKNKILKFSSIITIRGYGKFKIVEEIGWTNSGKVKILVKKFI
ncbi:RNA-binding protein [Clostridium sp. P21]|uniref:RNA-binding protein n=1 Tax=Clostridium muellerianum TaxID=2716538 RepID=A0A7Y0HMX1_9CLOT|nr:RNA-binding protein [Clostridium muellerianum]